MGARQINGLWQIAGWEEFETVAAPVLQSLGLASIGSYRISLRSDTVTAWRVAPDRILIEGSGDLSEHASEQLAVLDLGHARTAITLSGPAVRDLLSQVVSVDMSPEAFGTGEFVQTGLHHVGVLLGCTGPDSFEVLVPCTWGETVWEALLHNALPHGVSGD